MRPTFLKTEITNSHLFHFGSLNSESFGKSETLRSKMQSQTNVQDFWNQKSDNANVGKNEKHNISGILEVKFGKCQNEKQKHHKQMNYFRALGSEMRKISEKQKQKNIQYLWCFLTLSTFHLQASQNIVFFVLCRFFTRGPEILFLLCVFWFSVCSSFHVQESQNIAFWVLCCYCIPHFTSKSPKSCARQKTFPKKHSSSALP